MSPLMTPEQAAPFFGLAARTLKKKAQAGLVQHTRPAGTNLIMFSEEDILAQRAKDVRVPASTPTLIVRSRRAA